MTTRDRLTIAAAVAVALATSALRPLYEDLGWLLPVLGAVVAVSGAAALARLAAAPRALQPVVSLLGLFAYTALTFAGSTLSYGLLPTLDTATSLLSTFRDGMAEVEVLAPPVPTSPELVLLAVLGAGAVMVAVDAVAVVLRKVAASGLPLLVLFAVPSGVMPGGLGISAFVLGAAGWLGLLLADGSDRVSRWGTPLQSARAQSDPGLGRVGRRIGGAALGVAVVVPALVPGLDGRLLGGNGTGGLGGSRTTTTYNPLTELGGQLRQGGEETLLTYRTTEGADYLRLTTLDRFDRDRGVWSASGLSADPEDDLVEDGVPTPVGRSAPTEEVDITIELTGELEGPWLPVPAVPAAVAIDGVWLWDAEAETVFSTRTSTTAVDDPYTVTTSRVQPDVALLRQEQSVPASIEDTYADDPELSDEAQAVLERVTAGARTDFDRVAALQAYFRGPDFVYDLSTLESDAPDDLTAFLETRQGFCEQFASAMAALVRGAGIPARVAVGFASGGRDDEGRYTVTTRQAHAWPEVWFQGAGWVRFEPTPRSDDIDVEAPDYSVAPPESDGSTTPSAAPSTAPAAPQTGPDAAPGAIDRAGEEGLTSGAGGGLDDGTSPWWLLVPGALAVLGVPALLAAVRRRLRWRSPDALSAWESVGDDAVDVGHRWRPADSPRAAAAHLTATRHLPDDAADALTRLAAGAERARYARTAPSADGSVLRADAGLVRAALLAGASPRERWLARLLPRSTVRSTSSRAGTAVADVLDRFDVLVSTVGGRLRHPRTRAGRAS